jgi:hypothetical protein
MHNITFVNKANFVKLYNNFVLKWLIFALYVVVVPEQNRTDIVGINYFADLRMTFRQNFFLQDWFRNH